MQAADDMDAPAFQHERAPRRPVRALTRTGRDLRIEQFPQVSLKRPAGAPASRPVWACEQIWGKQNEMRGSNSEHGS